MDRKLFLLILIIPNIIYCQDSFKVSDLKDLNSNLISILNKKNIFPSDVQSSEINITDLINVNNLVKDNATNGIYSIYYHYHWNSYLLFKNKNEFILYTNPLNDTDSLLKKVIELDKPKKESKKYLKEIYNHLYYLIEEKYSIKGKILSVSESKVFKDNKKDKIRSEQKRIKKEYKYYLDLIRS